MEEFPVEKELTLIASALRKGMDRMSSERLAEDLILHKRSRCERSKTLVEIYQSFIAQLPFNFREEVFLRFYFLNSQEGARYPANQGRRRSRPH